MKKYKIVVEVISDTLFGSTEGSAAIDSSTRAYKNGLPYIPAKTFKGLLKESAIEVIELRRQVWSPDDKKDIINQLFGMSGVGNEGKLHFLNLDVIDKDSYMTDIILKKLLPAEVLSYFTKIRYQTALENGVAKENSLRTSRVLKSGIKFLTYLESHAELSEKELNLLNKACLNLRRVGTNRNRGFGKVKVHFHKDALQANDNSNELTGNTFKITLTSPALLPATQVDANTVSSESIISGRKLLGMLASAYIKKNNIKVNAHKNPEFKRLFLSGAVRFNDAYPVNSNKACVPLGNHWVITKAKDKVRNDYANIENLNFKSIGGMISLDGQNKGTVEKTLEFHNSRNKKTDDYKGLNTGLHTRIAGSNKGAGIFYYENLEKEQEYIFRINGQTKDLKILRELLNNYETLRIGKSTSTNLGRIKIENWGDIWISDNSVGSKKVMLTFISPTILKNKWGVYRPDIDTLSEYLDIEIEPENSRLRNKKVIVFQGKINMQLPEIKAIAAGSSILVDKANISGIKHQAIGEFTHEGFGQFIIEDFEDDTKQNNLKELLSKDEQYIPPKQPQTDSSEKDSKFLNWIEEQREILKARNNGNKHGNKKIHKSTTMLMIALLKNAKFKINNGKPFKQAIEESLDEQFESGVYSKKTVETLEKIFNNQLKGDIQKKRKENPEAFKKKLKEWITQGLNKIEKDYNLEKPKVNYWLSHFNAAKIKNREK